MPYRTVQRVEIACRQCGTIFEADPKDRRVACSRRCANVATRNKGGANGGKIRKNDPYAGVDWNLTDAHLGMILGVHPSTVLKARKVRGIPQTKSAHKHFIPRRYEGRTILSDCFGPK